jgi:hypothetical protein
MRTTIDLDLDTLLAAKEIARAENVSVGKVVSRLLRMVLTGQHAQGQALMPEGTVGDTNTATGFVPFAPRGVVVSNELIDKLRDSEGV